jgi:outer membrane protein TolC
MKIYKQSNKSIFQPCKGEILVARGKATKECRPGLEERQIYRPRFNFVQSTNPVSDGMARINSRLFHHFALTVLLIGLWVNGFSQQTDSLMSYLEIANKNNPTVLQRYTEYEAALQKVPQVGSLPDPELSLGVFLSPMELVSGNQLADIRLMQMFPWFGVLKNAKDEMSLMAKAKFETFRDAKLQLFFDVQRTWYEMNKVEQNIRISEHNLELLRTIERLSIVRFKAVPSGNNSGSTSNSMSSAPNPSAASASSGMGGMGGNSNNASVPSSSQASAPMGGNTMGSSSGGSGLSDVYRIQIEISDLQNNIELLNSQRNTLFAQFNGYLNRPQTIQVSLPASIVLESFDPAILTLSDSILSNNPMLGMLRFEQQSLEARKLMVTKMGYPMIGVGLNYSLIGKSEMSTSPMNGSDMIMPMVTATLPIYRKKYKAMQEEVELMKSANRQGYQATSNALQTEYYQAIQLHRDAARRMKLYTGQNQLASQSLDILLKSFASSGSDLTSILRVQQQKLDYELKQVEAVADYNTSVAWIKRLLAYSQIQ